MITLQADIVKDVLVNFWAKKEDTEHRNQWIDETSGPYRILASSHAVFISLHLQRIKHWEEVLLERERHQDDTESLHKCQVSVNDEIRFVRFILVLEIAFKENLAT